MSSCRALSCFALLLVSSLTTAAWSAPVRMAVMGDSISSGSGSNWIGQLNSSFPGAIAFQNKARGGATTDTVISQQLSSVVSLASGGQIDASVLIIGGNNASDTSTLINVFLGNPQPFIDNYVNDVKQILDSVAAAGPGVRQVFGNMPDVTVTPLVQSYAQSYGATPADLQVLSEAIGEANAEIDAYALDHGIPVLDLYSASQTILSQSSIVLGGHLYTTPFASDGFHPATWVQGLLAKMVTTAFNSYWPDMSLPLLSDQRIVTNTGYTPNSDTTYFDVSPFVLVPVPEVPTWALIATAIPIVIVWRRLRLVTPAVATRGP